MTFAWTCKWGTDQQLVVYADTIEEARTEARRQAAGPDVAVFARLATPHETQSPPNDEKGRT